MLMKKSIDEAAVKSCGGVLIPDGISLHGWTIASTHGPIATDTCSEQLKEELHVLTIPEQWYNNNTLALEHTSSGTVFSFQGIDALRQWNDAAAKQNTDANNIVHVAASEDWIRSRKSEMEAHHAKQLQYDWTYTTDYPGTTTTTSTASHLAWTSAKEGEQMDKTLLMSRDPILFFDDIPLYESELEDNGVSSLSVKIRVMPKCWYVLMRFFLRVDGVMVRLREVRLFHKFGDDLVLREIKHQEGNFQELRAGGAPAEGEAYSDGEAAAVSLSAVAPVGVRKYVVERYPLLQSSGM